MTGRATCCCFILPPVVLAERAEEGNQAEREAANKTLASSASMRARRAVVQGLGLRVAQFGLLAPPKGETRTVYDMENSGGNSLPGTKCRGEGEPPVDDVAVNEAYDGADATYDFYNDILGRDSIDDACMELVSSVHYGVDFDNAFWNGSQMVYGDGSGQFLAVGALTKDLAVIGHEMTHGVVQFTAGLRYSKQSGALNESFSDVMGAMVKQWVRKQTADEADWLIGEGVLGPSLPGKALRSMAEPGTAFKFDTQPAHMDDYQDLPDDNNPRNDNGGVHINSGIPNKAFYLAATALGGNSWERAGKIWYHTLCNKLGPNSTFKEAANATIASAKELFKPRGAEVRAVRAAWKQVGVL
jgi:Zn-dependent metalloprotease